jgi:hypothetical protein
MKFVCSLAWADLEVRKKERDFVHKLVKKLHLDEKEAKMVDEWLKVPPRAEEVDPAKVPTSTGRSSSIRSRPWPRPTGRSTRKSARAWSCSSSS